MEKRTKKLLQIKLVFWIELGLLCPKVFCFFFSKKKALLPCLVYRWDIGEELVRNFPVYIQEDFDRRQDFDMLLGMDWIAKHHLWLSYSTDSLYIDSGEKKPPEWKPAPKLPGE